MFDFAKILYFSENFVFRCGGTDAAALHFPKVSGFYCT
jgi:hypothetical protein